MLAEFICWYKLNLSLPLFLQTVVDTYAAGFKFDYLTLLSHSVVFHVVLVQRPHEYRGKTQSSNFNLCFVKTELFDCRPT